MSKIVQRVLKLPPQISTINFEGRKIECLEKFGIVEVVSKRGNKYGVPLRNDICNPPQLDGNTLMATVDTETWEVVNIFADKNECKDVEEEKEKYGGIDDLGGDY